MSLTLSLLYMGLAGFPFAATIDTGDRTSSNSTDILNPILTPIIVCASLEDRPTSVTALLNTCGPIHGPISSSGL